MALKKQQRGCSPDVRGQAKPTRGIPQPSLMMCTLTPEQYSRQATSFAGAEGSSPPASAPVTFRAPFLYHQYRQTTLQWKATSNGLSLSPTVLQIFSRQRTDAGKAPFLASGPGSSPRWRSNVSPFVQEGSNTPRITGEDRCYEGDDFFQLAVNSRHVLLPVAERLEVHVSGLQPHVVFATSDTARPRAGSFFEDGFFSSKFSDDTTLLDLIMRDTT